jgi:hydroxycarboxylate dehydrogenase B
MALRSLRAGCLMPTFTSDHLLALSRAICAAGGSAKREADLVADHLVEANLTGDDSHGVGLLPICIEQIDALIA